MSAREAGVIACKVLAVLVWVRGLQTVALILGGREGAEAVGLALAFGAAFAAGGAVVFTAGRWLPAGEPREGEPMEGEAGRAATWARMAFSVLGMWLVVQHLPALATFSWLASQGGDSYFGWESLVANVLAVAMGLALFLQVPGFGWIQRRALGRGAPTAAFDPVQALAFSLLGFYFLAWGAIGVLDNGLQLVTRLDELREGELWTRTWMARALLADAITLGFGLAVFLGSRRVSGLWHRLQGAAPRAA